MWKWNLKPAVAPEQGPLGVWPSCVSGSVSEPPAGTACLHACPWAVPGEGSRGRSAAGGLGNQWLLSCAVAGHHWPTCPAGQSETGQEGTSSPLVDCRQAPAGEEAHNELVWRVPPGSGTEGVRQQGHARFRATDPSGYKEGFYAMHVSATV